MKLQVIGKRLAFTLAEVLITLGIIGIVAEMTIPTLMNSVGEASYYTGAKKAYSTLSQALLLMESDPNKAMDSTDKDTILASFLKVMKNIGNGTAVTLFGSTPYSDYKCYTSSYTVAAGQVATYGLDSGILVVFFVQNCNNLQNGSCAELYYDTNGLKKPNMMGYDFISFMLYKENNLYKIIPKGSPIRPFGYSCAAGCGNEYTTEGCSYYRVMGMPMP